MRKVILAFTVFLAAQAACSRRPPKEQSSVEQFTAPAPPGKEEKWVEPEPVEEKKPEPPPPPPEPTSPPPEEGLGYKFGGTKNETMRRCSKKGTWSKKGGNYGCSRGLENAIAGKPVLSFCDEKLCAVGVAIVVEGTDFAAWNARFEELKAELVKAHGPPTVDSQNIGDECKNEKFVSCLDEGKASAEATWKWKTGHRVSLTMAKKASGDGPSAIRFVSLTNG